jgi:hypothetical protein
MEILNWIKSWLKSDKRAEAIEVPPGMCSMCWGRQEYLGEFEDSLNRKHIDLNNIEQEKGWIQAHAAKHFQGIILEEKEGQSHCPSCGKNAPL